MSGAGKMQSGSALRQTVVRRLLARSGFARRWFRLPSDDSYDPERNARIVAKVKARVFGERDASTLSSEASPLELLRRSYGQHLCQMEAMNSRLVRYLQNAVAAVALLPCILWWLGRYVQGRMERGAAERPVVIAFDYAPFVRSFVEGLRPGVPVLWTKTRRAELSPGDLAFAFRLIVALPVCWLDFQFLLKVLFGIGSYSSLIRRYRPKEILDFHEHFAPVSLQTAYCRSKGVRHVNVMHGHRAPVADFSFATFDQFYVWGEHYKEVFTSVCCPRDQFTVAGNPMHQSLLHKREAEPVSGRPKPRLLVCYEPVLGASPAYLELLVRLVSQLPENWSVALRCRAPRAHEHTTGESFAQVLDGRLRELGRMPVQVERELEKSLEDSIAAAGALVGIYSTSLLDGWVAGRKVIRLRSKVDPFCVPADPYSGSANVLTYDEETFLGDFLAKESSFDHTEREMLNRISYQAAPQERSTGDGTGMAILSVADDVRAGSREV